MKPVVFACFCMFVACATKPTITWEQTAKKPTISNLRRYIFLYPNTEESTIARMQLESLLAREALREGSIARLQAFLQEFPNSAHSSQIREALVAAQAKRAMQINTPWALLRFLYLYPRSSHPAIRLQLEETWWKELKTHPNPRQILHYVEIFPQGKYVIQARELLAETLYKKLGPDPAPEILQVFAAQHPQTSVGQRALQQLRFWERALVLLHGTHEELLRSIAQNVDFPEDLLEIVSHAHVEAALWDFDIPALIAWCTTVKKACTTELVQTLAIWQKMSSKARENLATMVRAAGPFRPMPALASLEIALHVEDLHTIWMALEALTWRPEPRALALLLQQAGAAEPAIAWPAAAACQKWLKRWPKRARVLAMWHLRKLANQQDRYENVMRIVLLNSFLGNPLPVENIAKLPIIEPWTLSTLVLQAETLPQPPWERLREEWNVVVKRLRDLFPSHLDAGTFPLARNLARRAFMLVQRMESLPLLPNSQGGIDQITELKNLLLDWETRLTSFAGYIRCSENPLPQQANQHRLQQEPARIKLLADPRQAKFWKTVWSVPENSPYLPTQL